MEVASAVPRAAKSSRSAREAFSRALDARMRLWSPFNRMVRLSGIVLGDVVCGPGEMSAHLAEHWRQTFEKTHSFVPEDAQRFFNEFGVPLRSVAYPPPCPSDFRFSSTELGAAPLVLMASAMTHGDLEDTGCMKVSRSSLRT